MSSGARLLANFGAEEGDGWRTREASLRGIAQLWGLLFGAQSRLLGDFSEIPWPSSLGERPPGPVFPWLEDAGGLVCWLETSAAREDPHSAACESSGPSPASVSRTHDKAFAHQRALSEGYVPRCLRDLICVLDPSELENEDAAIRQLNSTLAAWPDWARARFSLKPRFGSSGRGRVAGVKGEADTPEIRGALSRLASHRGALLEPWLERSLDLSAQLLVDPRGGTTMLGTLQQLLTPAGVYRGHRGWLDSKGRVFSGSDYDEPLREAAAALANAAAQAGYAGPAGVDGFAFRLPGEADGGGEAREIFRPVVEFNARFTLGTIVLGLARRALHELKAPLGLEPGNRRAFVFGLTAPAEGWRTAASRAGRLALLVPLGRDGVEADAEPAFLFAESDTDLDEIAVRIGSS